MDLDKEMDAELRELFTSDRLDVSVREDAEQVIVAGARRLRRRRIATATASGALGVVAAVVAGFIIAGGRPDAMPPAIRNTSKPPAAPSVEVSAMPSPSTAAAPPLGTTTTPPPKPPPPAQTKTSDPGPPNLNFQVIGPTGVRALELGQTLEEAQATGLLGPQISDTGCAVYELITDDRGTGQVYLSGTVQAIAMDPAQTPQGVGPGWTIEQVKDVYPDLDEQAATENGRALVPVPGNPAANFRLEFSRGEVSGVSLQFADQTCYE